MSVLLLNAQLQWSYCVPILWSDFGRCFFFFFLKAWLFCLKVILSFCPGFHHYFFKYDAFATLNCNVYLISGVHVNEIVGVLYSCEILMLIRDSAHPELNIYDV